MRHIMSIPGSFNEVEKRWTLNLNEFFSVMNLMLIGNEFQSRVPDKKMLEANSVSQGI